MKNRQKDHATLAEEFNKDEDRVNWHDGALWWIRQKRDRSANQIPGWEDLRQAASEIKSNVISNLHDYLVQFEANALKNGVLLGMFSSTFSVSKNRANFLLFHAYLSAIRA